MTETNARAELARTHLAAALIEAGIAPGLAKRLAEAADISAAGDDAALVQVSELRAVDMPASLAALAQQLLGEPAVAGVPAVVDDVASSDAARHAHRAAVASAF